MALGLSGWVSPPRDETGGDPAVPCGHRGCARPERETLLTWPTAVTVARTVVSLALGLAGIAAGSLTLLLWSLGVYWVGDTLDGELARLLDQETRAGAVADILSDRLCSAVFYCGLLTVMPEMVLPVGIYLANFMVVDMLLSLAFLAWPLSSPNYFYRVDRTLWLANWSRIGKGLNSGLIALLMIVTGSVWLSATFAALVLGAKIASLVRLSRLGVPTPSGCAAAAARTGTLTTAA